MQVERERELVPFHGTDVGAGPGVSPVRDVIEEAEARLRDADASEATGDGTAAYNAFEGSEARWLSALADWRSLTATDLPVGGEAAEDVVLKAERAAAAEFALVLSPDLMTLSRKLWLIEMEAFEAAHHGASSKELPIWLAAFRVDLMRLLSQASG